MLAKVETPSHREHRKTRFGRESEAMTIALPNGARAAHSGRFDGQ